MRLQCRTQAVPVRLLINGTAIPQVQILVERPFQGLQQTLTLQQVLLQEHSIITVL